MCGMFGTGRSTTPPPRTDQAKSGLRRIHEHLDKGRYVTIHKSWAYGYFVSISEDDAFKYGYGRGRTLCAAVKQAEEGLG